LRSMCSKRRSQASSATPSLAPPEVATPELAPFAAAHERRGSPRFYRENRMGDSTVRELVYGRGAHVDPVASIEDVPAELAARLVAGSPHSIWQIVEHMNYWMDYDLAIMAGDHRPYPNQAGKSWPAHPGPAADHREAEQRWLATIRRFTDLLVEVARLAGSNGAVLERKVFSPGPSPAPRETTVHAMLYQITAHNSYHAGQIVLLRRQAGAWPPERGGDTW
jgi:uncharacterized damage-inducible protein DinB